MRLDALAHTCIFLRNVPTRNFQQFYSDDSIYDTIEGVAPDLDYVIKECRWKGKSFKCSDQFTSIFTQWGLCFTFNALNSHDVYTNK